MAKSLLGATLRAIKAAERESARKANAATRAYNADLKERARVAKALERQLKQAQVANEKERTAKEKAVKAAHVEAQLAEVDGLNAQIEDVSKELEQLLAATLTIDDFVDLEMLRKPTDLPFDKPELEIPLSPPPKPKFPIEPQLEEPAKPKGLFSKKKKMELAKQEAQDQYTKRKITWDRHIVDLQKKYDTDLKEHLTAEKDRMEKLALETERFNSELAAHNQSIDKFISNLAYGDSTAVQDYIALVVENSCYPDHFPVEHDFSFVPADAELRMQVSIMPPAEFPSTKAYKYVKASDEIRSTPLSQAELKKRYASAIHQVAVRSIHEVFEADRRGLIKTISLEVGTMGNSPATGKLCFIPLVAVSAEKTSFMEFDLSKVVPLATLQHLGASISKDPINLVATDISGIRKS